MKPALKSPSQFSGNNFADELYRQNLESLPSSCSPVCQCRDLPTRCREHARLPCSLDISRSINHTHVTFARMTAGRYSGEETDRIVKLCVSQKCIDPQDLFSLKIPERSCLLCYDQRVKIEQLDTLHLRLLLHNWRINRPSRSRDFV